MASLLPNFSQAIYLQGEITQTLVDRIVPQVLLLQQKSMDRAPEEPQPITVVIDSFGGSPGLAMQLLDLMRGPCPGGENHLVITYITGVAASAAADFAIQSDYCFMAQGAFMLCHGTSRGGNPTINVQTAESLAENLRRDNEVYARKLAEAAFPRLLFRLTASGIQSMPAFLQDPSQNLAGLCQEIQEKLMSHQLREMMQRALKRQHAIRDLSIVTDEALNGSGGLANLNEQQSEEIIYKAVLDKKLLQAKEDSNWSLAKGGLDEIMADFRLLLDYRFGSLNRTVRKWMAQYGVMFLLNPELVEYEEVKKRSEEERQKWLFPKVGARIRQLWYFFVSISRLLQEEDFSFDPEDAYWLGLVDEIPGSELPSLRVLIEAGST